MDKPSRERSPGEVSARDRSLREHPEMEESHRNPEDGGAALFPRANLHRPLPYYARRSTNYIRGREYHGAKFHRNYRKLYHGKADREVD